MSIKPGAAVFAQLAAGLALSVSCSAPSNNNLGTVMNPAAAVKTVILLDLNYTLVGNQSRAREQSGGDPEKQVDYETYRTWLTALLEDHYVILITARPERYREKTLENIRAAAPR